MRRYERYETGGGKGFRIIEAGGRYLEPLTPPPPPRAPEPYKVAPPSSALGRAHRRSSFVIIAETRPATPDTASPSPTLLPTGRVSPFRGRGFKGPPPHAQSRPQSPEIRPRNDRRRFDRRTSVSQQNSPRRSLIPQPTRRRSVSLTKNGEGKSSPKFGRRAQNGRTRNANGPIQLSVSTGNISRRGSLKAPDLSPIQGTPTKPNELDGRQRNGNLRRNVNAQGSRGTSIRTGNTLTVPRFNGNPRRPLGQERSPAGDVARDNNRRFVTEKRSNGENDSRTRIPTRRGSVVGKNGMNPPSSRFVSKNPPKQLPRPIKAANESRKEADDKGGATKSDEGVRESQTRTGEISTETRINEPSPSSDSKSRDNDLGLIDLLKNSSAATGTSSVVGTTTTTAVQPLQIDATSILLEKEGSKNSTPGSVEPAPKSSTTDPPRATNDKKNDGKAASQKNPAKSEPTTTTNSIPKKETNSTSNGTREKTLVGASGNSKKNLLGKSGAAETIKPETRVTSAKVETRANDSSVVVEETVGKSSTTADNVPGKSESTVTVENSGNSKSEGREKTLETETEKTLSRNVGGAKNTETTNAPVRVEANGADNKSRPNGSENSVKSSNGLSNVSADSIRSTDTGVSVDTVRGVSSAREKKGMHMMKRPEEIETLSGNIMHLERNGEPAVLDITGEAPEQDQTRLGRFKKSLTRFRDRFTNMRCLGCRRNQKGKSWLVKQRNEAHRNETAGSEPTNPPGNTRFSRMWASCRNGCRCARLRECQCCRRAARVSPAESTPCCPPERGCGAICGRIFSRCKCKKSDAQHTRSIRAKHSLTSVAPPPLSEEQRSKIPEVLVEHNSVMRGAIPCLPVPIAWFCLVWNVLLPGSGTIWSGLFNLCVGQPRFSISASPRARFGALVVNLIVGVSQFFTVLFCLVGWGWSIWWGVTMIRLARKYKRFRASEAANADLEARNGEQGLPASMPSQPARAR